jgi:hypothetical protein
MLMDLAYALGGATHTNEHIEEIRRRWVRLVERLQKLGAVQRLDRDEMTAPAACRVARRCPV